MTIMYITDDIKKLTLLAFLISGSSHEGPSRKNGSRVDKYPAA